MSADVRTVPRLSRWSAVSSLSSTRSVMPMMPFIGVRISWLMLARNSLLARLASIARSRAATSSSLTSLSSAVRASTARFEVLLLQLQLRDRAGRSRPASR